MAVLRGHQPGPVVDRVVVGGRLQHHTPLGPGLQAQVDAQQKGYCCKHQEFLMEMCNDDYATKEGESERSKEGKRERERKR